jgi:hypothetical protein
LANEQYRIQDFYSFLFLRENLPAYFALRKKMAEIELILAGKAQNLCYNHNT